MESIRKIKDQKLFYKKIYNYEMKQNIQNISINTANIFAFVAIWFAVITS